MSRFALVLACMAFTGHARRLDLDDRVPSSHSGAALLRSNEQDRALDPLNEFAKMLMAGATSTEAFNNPAPPQRSRHDKKALAPGMNKNALGRMSQALPASGLAAAAALNPQPAAAVLTSWENPLPPDNLLYAPMEILTRLFIRDEIDLYYGVLLVFFLVKVSAPQLDKWGQYSRDYDSRTPLENAFLEAKQREDNYKLREDMMRLEPRTFARMQAEKSMREGKGDPSQNPEMEPKQSFFDKLYQGKREEEGDGGSLLGRGLSAGGIFSKKDKVEK